MLRKRGVFFCKQRCYKYVIQVESLTPIQPIIPMTFDDFVEEYERLTSAPSTDVPAGARMEAVTHLFDTYIAARPENGLLGQEKADIQGRWSRFKEVACNRFGQIPSPVKKDRACRIITQLMQTFTSVVELSQFMEELGPIWRYVESCPVQMHVLNRFVDNLRRAGAL